MNEFDSTERGAMIQVIIDQTHAGLALFTAATTDIKLGEFAQELEDQKFRDDMIGLIIDCAVCLIPMGKLLGGFVEKLATFPVTEKITAATIEKAEKLAVVEIVPEISKELVKFVGKTVPATVVDKLTQLAPKTKQGNVILGALTDMFNWQTQLLRNYLRPNVDNLEVLPDALVARLFARWNPGNNKTGLYTQIVSENFDICKELVNSLGLRTKSTATKDIVTETKILFECLEAGDLDSAGLPEYVEVIPYVLISILTTTRNAKTDQATKIERTGNLKEVPSGLRNLATIAAFQLGSYWNDPFITYAFDPRESAFGAVQFVQTLRTVEREDRIVLKRNAKGIYGTNSPLSQHQPGSIRFDIIPSTEWISQ